jgi:hypothetical protein
MEITTFYKCSCADCGQIMEYQARDAGKTVECPKCKEKSQLPETEKLLMLGVEGPPLPTTKNCPACGIRMKFLEPDCSNCKKLRKKKLLGMVSAMVVVMFGAVWLFARHSKPKAGTNTVKSGTIMLAQPQVKQAKSANDLRPGRFSLEQRRGSDLVLAVGDIENVSENVYHGVTAVLDLLDASGAQIGTVTDTSVELGPHEIWHFLAKVTDPKVTSVKFASIKENQ